MNRVKSTGVAIVLGTCLIAMYGCNKEADSQEAAKKATVSQQATPGEPSLGNPKPANSDGSK